MDFFVFVCYMFNCLVFLLSDGYCCFVCEVLYTYLRGLLERCTRLAAASDKVCQLLTHGRWFSPGTLASFTTKTGRHDIAEILLKYK